MRRIDFRNSVFVNCPFDKDYTPLLRPLLFTVCHVGLWPRIALETLDSGETRITKILELIRASRFGIHDLSRLQAREVGEFYRLNMPFELGVDIGCRLFGAKSLRTKKCLILEEQPYRFAGALSDLAGSDIKHHGGKPARVVIEVRNWFVEQQLRVKDSGTAIWYAYNDCWGHIRRDLESRLFSPEEIDNLPVPEFLDYVDKWLTAHGRRSHAR